MIAEVLNWFLLIIMVYNSFGMMGEKKIPQVVPFKKKRIKNKTEEDRQNSENREAQR